MNGLSRIGFRGVVQKPGLIERRYFDGAQHVPLAVPDFNPGMVAAMIAVGVALAGAPRWRADKARGNSDRATGIDQQNRQAAAGSITCRNRFIRALVGL